MQYKQIKNTSIEIPYYWQGLPLIENYDIQTGKRCAFLITKIKQKFFGGAK